MARQITGIVPTTELEAINRMLSAIGEAPILQAELEDPSRPDTEMAVNFLTETTRQVLSMGWRFNMEFGFAVQDDDTGYSWTGSDGSTAELLVFERPSDLLDYELSQTSKQIDLNVTLRPPRDVSKAEGVLIFYDNNKNRDGFVSGDLEDDTLYIEGIFAIDFEDMPEVAREYTGALAAVRLQSRLMGSQSLGQDTMRELQAAWRNLKRAQGQPEDYNIFNNMDLTMKLGLHRRIRRGFRLDDRQSPRP